MFTLALRGESKHPTDRPTDRMPSDLEIDQYDDEYEELRCFACDAEILQGELTEMNNEPCCKFCKQVTKFIQEDIVQKGGELGQVYPIAINGKKGCFTKEILAEKLNFTGNILVLDDKNLFRACAFLTVKSVKEGEDLIQSYQTRNDGDQVITEIEWFQAEHLGFGPKYKDCI